MRFLDVQKLIRNKYEFLNYIYIQVELTAPREVASQCPLKSFKFLKTKEIPTGFYDIKTGHANIRTPWWYEYFYLIFFQII
jgi:hypothetical protein